MLKKIAKEIEMYEATKPVSYPVGTDLEEVIKSELVIFGVTGNGNKSVFHDAESAKKWKHDTNGTLCNIYRMLQITNGKTIMSMVAKQGGVVADLKTWMDVRGINQSELAELSGSNTGSISAYVAKHTEPKVSNAKRIADALGVRIDQIDW